MYKQLLRDFIGDGYYYKDFCKKVLHFTLEPYDMLLFSTNNKNCAEFCVHCKYGHTWIKFNGLYIR